MKTSRARGSFAAGAASVLILLLAGAVRSSGAESYLQGGSSSSQACTMSKIDLNQATVSELERVPGVRSGEAFRIVQYRDVHGPYRNFAELLRVRDVDPMDVANLQDHVALYGSTSGRFASNAAAQPMPCKGS